MHWKATPEGAIILRCELTALVHGKTGSRCAQQAASVL